MIVDDPSELLVDDVFCRLPEVAPPARSFLKLEALNQAGSIKLKPAVGMIDGLERAGRVSHSSEVIESSSGNLGVALAVVCAARGYRFCCVTDPNASPTNVSLIRAMGGEVVVFATSATRPHLDDPGLLAHRPLVLHLSLRDLSPAMIAAADNVNDDVDHVLSAQTSLHLSEQKLGHRDFVNGPLYGLLRGEVALSRDRPRIFSPFGLGVLDLAVARWVYRRAVEQNRAVEITDFLPVNRAKSPRADPQLLATTGVRP